MHMHMRIDLVQVTSLAMVSPSPSNLASAIRSNSSISLGDGVDGCIDYPGRKGPEANRGDPEPAAGLGRFAYIIIVFIS